MNVRALTSHVLNRHLAARLARFIPHPGVRLVATAAATFVIPLVVEHLLSRSVGAVARRVMPGPTPHSA